MLLALKMEEEMQVVSRRWKRKGDRFSPRASRRNAALSTL